MEQEFLISVISQFPTFAGLLILAYVQYLDSKRCDEGRAAADERYHELVKGMARDVRTAATAAAEVASATYQDECTDCP